MKQLRLRSVMVLCLIAFLLLGTAFFCGRYVADGAMWASSRVNSSSYSGNHLARGALYDRDGTLLYDAAHDSYATDKTLRTAALHLTGDREGNIAQSALNAVSRHLVGFSPITGLSSGTGHEVYLSIDGELQSLAWQCLKGQKGAAVVYDYKTGELLCAASAPSFDPFAPPGNIEGNDAYEGVYLNRAFSGLFAPGSTFKLVTAAAAIEKIPDLMERRFTCTGTLELDGRRITCPYKHGEMDFATALAHSCNCAFASLAVELGGETLQDYAEELGLLESFSVSGLHTAAGKFEIAESEGDLGWSGVGQHKDMVSPIAMLRFMGAVANGGTALTPRFFLKELDDLGAPVPTLEGKSEEKLLDASTAAQLRELMLNNVTVEYGTIFKGFTAGAKSGTAEVGEGKSPHSWFVGFLADEDVPLAFAVVVQNGGSGLKNAGAIADKLVAQASKMYRTEEAPAS